MADADIFLRSGEANPADIRLYPAGYIATAAAFVPFAEWPWFDTVLGNWQLPDPRPQGFQLNAAWNVVISANQPYAPYPFSIIAAWQSSDPLPQRSPESSSLPGWSVDSPAPWTSPAFAIIRTLLEPPLPLPVQGHGNLIVSVDQPPPWTNPVFNIIRWLLEPGPPSAPSGQHTSALPGRSIDQPHPWSNPTFIIIRGLNEPPAPQPPGTTRPLMYAIWSIDRPPDEVIADLPAFETLVLSWEPGPPPYQTRRPTAALPGWSVDAPTPKVNFVFNTIRWAWEPVPPAFQGSPKTAAPPGWSVDQPIPFVSKNATILRQLNEPGPPREPGLVRPPMYAIWSVDAPPPSNLFYKHAIVATWTGGDAIPQRWTNGSNAATLTTMRRLLLLKVG